jgi:hypothetical protein
MSNTKNNRFAQEIFEAMKKKDLSELKDILNGIPPNAIRTVLTTKLVKHNGKQSSILDYVAFTSQDMDVYRILKNALGEQLPSNGDSNAEAEVTPNVPTMYKVINENNVLPSSLPGNSTTVSPNLRFVPKKYTGLRKPRMYDPESPKPMPPKGTPSKGMSERIGKGGKRNKSRKTRRKHRKY